MKKLKEIAAYTLDALKNAGADDAQVSVAEGKIEEFNVDAGEFSLIRSVFNRSASMKVIKQHKKGTIAINQLDKEAIDSAVAECISAADASVEDDAAAISVKEENCDFRDGALTPDKDKFFDSLIKFLDDIKHDYPKIMVEQMIATYSCGSHVFANTNGVLFTETDGEYDVSVMYSAHDGENASSFNSFDVSFLDPGTDIMELAMARTMFERAEQELNTVAYDSKFVGTAVFSPVCLADFISIIVGTFAGDYALIEGTSPWKNSLGKKVADEKLTLAVIPRDERIVCGENITSDGYKSENFDVIKNGVLESFCLSDYAARKTGLKRAKSTSGCIEVKSGDVSFAEMISKIDKGILVCRFSGGEPANNGDFSGVAKNSFLIENGKIAFPISETMISGNLARMLENISAISSDTVNDGGSVLPYAAFEGVTVSGK